MIDEIKLSRCIDGCSGDREETTFQFRKFRFRRDNSGRVGRRGLLRIARDIQDRELALAYFEMMRNIFNRVFVGKLAKPQKRAATVLVADAVTALRVHVNIAEMNVG